MKIIGSLSKFHCIELKVFFIVEYFIYFFLTKQRSLTSGFTRKTFRQSTRTQNEVGSFPNETDTRKCDHRPEERLICGWHSRWSRHVDEHASKNSQIDSEEWGSHQL